MTSFSYRLAQPVPVTCRIFDTSGRQIRTLSAGRQEAGLRTLVWDRTDDCGRSVSAGVYVVRLTTGSVTVQDKVVVLE